MMEGLVFVVILGVAAVCAIRPWYKALTGRNGGGAYSGCGGHCNSCLYAGRAQGQSSDNMENHPQKLDNGDGLR